MTGDRRAAGSDGDREGAARSAHLEDTLRELGYLDAGVERFLGRPGLTGPRALRSTALRCALLAGLGLALAWALLHLHVDPSLLHEPARGLRLLLVLLGLGFGAAFGLGLAVLAVGRRASRANRGRAAGAAALLPPTLLLGLHLGLRRAAGPGLDDLVMGCVALGLLGGLAWLFRVVAEIAAGGAGRIGPRRGPGIALTIFALAAALGVGLALAPPRIEPRPASPFDVVQTGHRVAWIQVDGLSPARLDAALATADARDGAAGILARWRDAAAGQGEVAALVLPADLDPPQAWTTAATGRGAQAHGVTGLEGRRRRWGDRGVLRALRDAAWPCALDIETVTASALLRRLPTVAEIVAARDYRVLSLNAWCSGPGEGEDGIDLISDRALRALLAGGRSEPDPEDVHPPALRAEFEILREVLGGRPLVERKAGLDGALTDCLRRRLEATAERLPDLVVIGFSSLDLVALDGDEARTRAQLARLQAELARVVELLAPTHAVVISTGPGYAEPAAEGAVFLRGAPFRAAPGARLDLVDLAPTILRVLGFPRARDLDGRVAERLFDPEFLARFAPREIATHGDRRGGAVGDDRLAAEQLEALRTLGYGGGRR